MAEAHAKHPYHLVDPSPWPAVGAVSAFVLAVGLITWMRHMFAAAPIIFAFGALGIALVRIKLADEPGGALSLAFPGTCMHEVLFDDEFLKDTGVTTLDFAKALIDEGFHPMTMYFPLVVHGALLIEPTETESKASLDQFASVVNGLAARAQSIKAGAGGEAAAFHAAPRLTPRRRLDETGAARKPVLRWRPAPVQREAAD